MTALIKAPPADCPNDGVCVENELMRRRESDKNNWIRWGVGIALGIITTLVSWSLGWLSSHEQRLTTVEVGNKDLHETDRLIRAERLQDREEYRSDLKEIKKDIKELLARRSK